MTNVSAPEINIKKELKRISEKGFIKTRREGDTGIGYTLEEEIGITENNFLCHDLTFNNEPVELKAQRHNSDSNVTLITKSPHWHPLSPKEIITRYGYEDRNGRQGLKVTLTTTDFNAQGLKLELKGGKLNVVHKTDGVICYFVMAEIMEKLRGKIAKHLLLVIAERKFIAGIEYFHYNDAAYLTDLSESNFLHLLEQGIIVWEFRMHIKPSGAVRDHGAGFRLNKQYIPNLYGSQKTIL